MKVTFLKQYKFADTGDTFEAGDSASMSAELAGKLFADGTVTAFVDQKISETKQIDKSAIDAEVAKQVAEAIEGAKQVDPPAIIGSKSGAQTQTVEVGEEVVKTLPNAGFKSASHFYYDVYQTGIGKPTTDCFKNYITKAATGMSQGIGSDGGFLVPPQYSAMIWDGLNQASDNLLLRTDNYTVTGESLTFNANAETSRATGSRWGGVRGYWLSEAAQITSSRPKLRQVKIEPQQMAVLIYATDKLLNNGGPAVEQYLTRAAIDEISALTGDAIINGTGAGQPTGVLNGGCTVSVPKESGQAAATIKYENILNMWARLHPRSRANAVWFINVDCEPQLNQMTIGIGTAGQPVYLPPGGVASAPYGTLMGRQVVPIEYCATLGTVGDIILADMKAYLTGTRGNVDSAMSMHLRFDYAETAFRFMYEVDGRPWLASAITPLKGSNTLSPFVTLATRS